MTADAPSFLLYDNVIIRLGRCVHQANTRTNWNDMPS